MKNTVNTTPAQDELLKDFCEEHGMTKNKMFCFLLENFRKMEYQLSSKTMELAETQAELNTLKRNLKKKAELELEFKKLNEEIYGIF